MSLKETQGGNALRLLEEAKRLAAGAIPLAAAYNKAEPSTPAATHTEFDRDLNICVDAALARVRFAPVKGSLKRPATEFARTC